MSPDFNKHYNAKEYLGEMAKKLESNEIVFPIDSISALLKPSSLMSFSESNCFSHENEKALASTKR